MDISVFEIKLKSLLNEVAGVSSKSHKTMLLGAPKSEKAKTAIQNTDTLEESMDHLRLVVKYLLFDIEATKRENRYLRRILEGQED